MGLPVMIHSVWPEPFSCRWSMASSMLLISSKVTSGSPYSCLHIISASSAYHISLSCTIHSHNNAYITPTTVQHISEHCRKRCTACCANISHHSFTRTWPVSILSSNPLSNFDDVKLGHSHSAISQCMTIDGRKKTSACSASLTFNEAVHSLQHACLDVPVMSVTCWQSGRCNKHYIHAHSDKP